MRNVGGQPYSCADCEFQHLDWERMQGHIRKRHNREPHCGPDAAITPENLYVGAVLVDNNTMKRVRIVKIIDRDKLKVEVEWLSPLNVNLLEFNPDSQEWGFA